MPLGGYCTVCQRWVWLTPYGECQNGHPALAVKDVQQLKPQAEPDVLVGEVMDEGTAARPLPLVVAPLGLDPLDVHARLHELAGVRLRRRARPAHAVDPVRVRLPRAADPDDHWPIGTPLLRLAIPLLQLLVSAAVRGARPVHPSRTTGRSCSATPRRGRCRPRRSRRRWRPARGPRCPRTSTSAPPTCCSRRAARWTRSCARRAPSASRPCATRWSASAPPPTRSSPSWPPSRASSTPRAAS